MKAKELITELEKLIVKNGDCEVVFSHAKQSMVCRVNHIRSISKECECEINENFDCDLIILEGR